MQTYQISRTRMCAALVSLAAGSLVPLAASAQVASTLPPPDISNPGGVVSVGGDVSGSGFSGYVAGTVALNGDQTADGFLLRATAGAGEYKSGTTPFATDDVSFYSASLMVGFQKRLGDVQIAGFAGPELVHNGKGADPRVRGSETAARFIGEISAPGSEVDFSLWSTYSTFENQYMVNTRAMFHGPSDKPAIGPDAALFGGDGWQRARGGLYLVVPSRHAQFGIGTGYDFDLKGDVHEAPYVNVSVNFPIR
jgi:hypothetical protein